MTRPSEFYRRSVPQRRPPLDETDPSEEIEPRLSSRRKCLLSARLAR
jgi:hypothetical protein